MFEWSEEQLMIRDAVRQFVQAEIAPTAGGARARRPAALRHPPQAVRHLRHGRDGARGLQGAHRAREAHRGRGGGAGRDELRRGRRRGRGLHAHPDHRDLPALAGHGHRDGRVDGADVGGDHVEGHDRPEGAVGARPAHDGQGRCVGDHRAGFGVRRVRLDEVDGAPGRRRVRPQRLEDLHHERSLRRHHRVHLQARRGQPAGGAQGPQLRPRQGDAGLRAAQAAAEDGHALLTHRRAVPDRRPGGQGPAARGDRGRRRRWPRGRQGHLLHGALRRRRHVARDHRALPRAVGAVRQGPRAVRSAHRRVPAHPGQARPHGGGAPQRAEPRVPHRRDGPGRQEPDASPRRRR